MSRKERDRVFAEGTIAVRGAREHNLADIDVELPRNRLVVITGVSGSGKSTLAFDTIFAEGQRRYVESLSAYARQFLGQMQKPDVDAVDGLSPAIAIDQKSTSHNPRSTVGTVTEIWDYLRLLWARLGAQHCAVCDWPGALAGATVDEIVDGVLSGGERRVTVLAPIIERRKGAHVAELDALRNAGYARARHNGQLVTLDDLSLDPKRPHTVECAIDRIRLTDASRGRLVEAVEAALKLSGGTVVIADDDGDTSWSTSRSCPQCHTSYRALEPRSFSFNSPYGACSRCDGLGSTLTADLDRCVPDPTKTLTQGAIVAWGTSMSGQYARRTLEWCASGLGVRMDVPFAKLTARERTLVLHGGDPVTVTGRHGRRTVRYEGLEHWLLRRYRDASDASRERIAAALTPAPCPDCSGTRLADANRAVRLRGASITELASLAVDDLRAWFDTLALDAREQVIGARIVRELAARIGFLTDVGLGYLSLDRAASSLSGGEAQRIRLASQIGSGLVGVCYVLDEPSIGLHPRDNHRLLASLARLRDLGNTVLVVEHDLDTMAAADWIVDIGPGAGEHGGHVVTCGTPASVATDPVSVTGAYLSGRKTIAVPERRRPGSGALVVERAAEHNLADVTVRFPLQTLCGVAGVSGSGKSTLVADILAPAVARGLGHPSRRPGAHRRVRGVEHIDKLVEIDQSPIGRTPRSNPATYVGVFDKIRTLYAELPESQRRGWRPGRFSFNVPATNGGGRCEACAGEGQLRIEMHFLPDVWVPCEVCHGSRYAAQTLVATYRDHSIAQVLDLTVDAACELFKDRPPIARQLTTLADVGLGYVRLGQPATTLSGGEAQRVKLAAELQRRATGRTLYICDEPTTGLHFADVAVLLSALERLVDAGNSVVVIEHNLDVLKRCDWIVELGPDGGAGGGQLVAAGTPEALASAPTATGAVLAEVLGTMTEAGETP